MRSLRFRDDEPSFGDIATGIAVGALAGFAVGVVVAQKVGGIAGLAARLRGRLQELRRGGEGDEDDVGSEYDELTDEDAEDAETALEERVLEAFRNDPVLSERAVDIGAIGDGIIELSGWVDSAAESKHATTIARGTPGVTTVVNRIAVGDEEEMTADEEGAREENEPIPGGRWEGQRVGTGRRRQGSSAEPGHHADPKPDLEARWLDEQHALEEAAGDTQGVGERRRTTKKSQRGGRTDGSPVAPTGVPKADHVADPESSTEPRAD